MKFAYHKKLSLYWPFIFLIFLFSTSLLYADIELKETKISATDPKGNQTGYSVQQDGKYLYMVGSEVGKGAFIAKYPMPPTNDTPQLKYTWADVEQTAVKTNTTLSDIAVSSDAVYSVGSFYKKFSGKKKNEELSGLLVKFPHGQSNPQWVIRSDFYPKQDQEEFRALLVVQEKNQTYIYVTGTVSTQENNSVAILAKYNSEGQLLWNALLGDKSEDAKSVGTDLAFLDNCIYVAGYTKNDSKPAPTLWKYDSQGARLWERNTAQKLKTIPNSAHFSDGIKVSLVESDGFLYLASSKEGSKSNPADLFFLKYNAKGDLLWENAWKASLPSSQFEATGAWATSLASGSDRLYVAGFIDYTDKINPGQDTNTFILEIDKDYGSLLAAHTQGDRDQTEQAYSVTNTDKEVLITGFKKMSARKDGKDSSQDSKLLLSRYSVMPIAKVRVDINPGSAENVITPYNKDSKLEDKKEDIPVAIFSSNLLNVASELDLSSLTFGRTGHEVSLSGCAVKDVDQNGSNDLLCHFKPAWTPWKEEKAIFEEKDKIGILRAQTISGERLTGTDSMRLANKDVQEPAPIIETPSLFATPLVSTPIAPTTEPQEAQPVAAIVPTLELSAALTPLAPNPAIESVPEPLVFSSPPTETASVPSQPQASEPTTPASNTQPVEQKEPVIVMTNTAPIVEPIIQQESLSSTPIIQAQEPLISSPTTTPVANSYSAPSVIEPQTTPVQTVTPVVIVTDQAPNKVALPVLNETSSSTASLTNTQAPSTSTATAAKATTPTVIFMPTQTLTINQQQPATAAPKPTTNPVVTPAKYSPVVPAEPSASRQVIQDYIHRTLYSQEPDRPAMATAASSNGPLRSDVPSQALKSSPMESALQNNPENTLQQKAEYSPSLAREYGKIGKEALKNGDVQKATTNYEEALRLDPTSPQIHTEFALLLIKSGKLNEAAAHLTESLKLNPKDKVAQENLDQILIKIKTTQEYKTPENISGK